MSSSLPSTAMRRVVQRRQFGHGVMSHLGQVQGVGWHISECIGQVQIVPAVATVAAYGSAGACK